MAFGLVGMMALLIFAFVAVNMFLTMRGGGLFGRMIERAERMQREQREHELRLAEFEAAGRRPWTCGHCDARNEATQPECNGCGAPRDDESR